MGPRIPAAATGVSLAPGVGKLNTDGLIRYVLGKSGVRFGYGRGIGPVVWIYEAQTLTADSGGKQINKLPGGGLANYRFSWIPRA